MEDKQDMEDLERKVKEMFRRIAIKHYGFPSVPTVHTRERWQKVFNTAEIVLDTTKDFKLICEAARNIVDEYLEFFQPPNIWRGEILRLKRKELAQNNKVDDELERGRQLRMNRNELIKQWESKVGETGAREIERLWINNQSFPDLFVYRLDFWGRLYLQEEEALNIIKLYEETNGKTN